MAVGKKRRVKYDPEERVGYGLFRAQHASLRALLAKLSKFDMNTSHFGILWNLDLEPGLTGAEIARRLDVTPQSVSAAVASAKQKGWIRGKLHAIHRGLVELELTAAGRVVLDAAIIAVGEVEAQLDGKLSAAERDTLRSLLRRVRDAYRDAPLSE